MGSLPRLLLIGLLLGVVPASALAQEARPHATAHQGDFAIMALVTADPGWVKEWSRTDGQPPRLVATSQVGIGETAQVLIAFSGAKPIDGRALVECEVRMLLPDGSSQGLPPSPCFDRPLDGPADAVRLLDVDMGVRVEATDPSGLYEFDVTATDKGSGRTVSVSVSVSVIAGTGT